MKKIIPFFLIVIFIYACQKPLKERIIGTWQIKDIAVLNIDSLAKTFYFLQKNDLQKKIDYYKKLLSDSTNIDEGTKSAYQQNLNMLQQELKNLSIDKIKKDILKNAYPQYRKIQFLSDSTFIYYDKENIPLTAYQTISGIWRLSPDEKKLILKNQQTTLNMNILETSQNSITLYYEEQNGDIIVKIKLTLQKISNEKNNKK